MIKPMYITYHRISLSVLVGDYEKNYLNKEVKVIGHAYDARKDDVIIEIMLPEKDR